MLGNQSTRMGGIKNIGRMITRIFKSIWPILKYSIGTFPKYAFILVFFVTVLFTNIEIERKSRCT